MKNNLIILVSSKNNYEMLENEVLKNFDAENFEIINVDDNSEHDQKNKGRSICYKNNIVFLENKSVGIQWSVQTAINFVKENRKNCEWLITTQHDCYPITKNFFSRIGDLIHNNKLTQFSSIGFNILDNHSRNKSMRNQIKEFYEGKKPVGMLGLMHLSYRPLLQRFNHMRALSPLPPMPNDTLLRYIFYNIFNHTIASNKKFKKPFIIEIPWWPIVGINIESWNKFITPTNKYKLHLWFPDIMMSFNKNNCPCLILPDLYCLNNQSLKKKYNILENSAAANRSEMQAKKYFGFYGEHLNIFRERWGWDYNKGAASFDKIKNKYVNTLLYEYSNHNIKSGPLKNFDLGEY